MLLPNLSQKLNFQFQTKPLLVGGLAMEFYGLRKSGPDVDFILEKNDHLKLKAKLQHEGLKILPKKHQSGYKKTPQLVNLFGDHGILIYEFEIWDQICGFDYYELSYKALTKSHCKIISLEKLLLMKALAIDKNPKYLQDVKLIVKKIIAEKYQ